jgi:hypothetical protein
MICNCINCHRAYWRYRLDWETLGFCTQLCRALWLDERAARGANVPGKAKGASS